MPGAEQLSDEELQKLAAPSAPADGGSDLSQHSDEDLMKIALQDHPATMAEKATGFVKSMVPDSPMDLLKTTAGASVGVPAVNPTVERFKALPPETQDKLLRSIAPTAVAVALPELIPALEAPAGAGVGAKLLAAGGRAAVNGLAAGAGQATEETQNAALDRKMPNIKESAGRIGDAAETGAGLSLGIEGAAKAVEAGAAGFQKLYRGAVSIAKGTGARVVDRVFDAAKNAPTSVKEAASDFFKAVAGRRNQAAVAEKAAGEKMFNALGAERNEAAGQLAKAKAMPVGGSDTTEVADKATKLANTLREESSKISEEAAQHLSPTPDIPPSKLLLPLKKAQNSLKVRGKVVGDASKEAVGALERWYGDIKSITTKTVPGESIPQAGGYLPAEQTAEKVLPNPISEQDVKKVIQKIDQDVVWDKVKGQPAEEKMLKEVRGVWARLLDRNDSYRKAISPVHDLIRQADDFEKSLGLERGLNREVRATDLTHARLKSMFSGGKPVGAEAAAAGGRFEEPLAAGAKNLADTTAKEEAIKLAETRLGKQSPVTPAIEDAKRSVKKAATRMNEPVPSLDDVQALAEAAASAGTNSPAMNKLAATISKVLPGKGAQTAEELATAAAHGMFARGKAKSVTGITANLAGAASAAGENLLPGVSKNVDDLITALSKGAKNVHKVSGKLSGAAGRGLSEALQEKK